MPTPHEADDSLAGMLPPVGAWFRATFGAPSRPQRLGWPRIAAGRNTLILAPTGSGKTLAAFLACLDHLWRNPVDRADRPRPVRLAAEGAEPRRLPEPGGAARRDRRDGRGDGDAAAPALGRRPDRRHDGRGTPSPRPTAARAAHHDPRIAPPDADEPGAAILRGVTHVIVDEIHALCGEKRGVFLALLLERLEALVDRPLRPDRPLGDAAAAGGGRPLPRGLVEDGRAGRGRRGGTEAGRDRRRRRLEGAGPRRRVPGGPGRAAPPGRRSRPGWRS